MRNAVRLAAVAAALCAAGVHAQTNVTIVSHPLATMPQYTKVDVPLLREELPKKAKVSVNLAAWSERNVAGPEVLRLVRSGQVDIGAAPLATVSGDVPFLDAADLAGLNPTIEQARKAADAMVPLANKELERVGLRIIGTFPYTAQVFFCRGNVASLADLKGKKVRSFGGSLNDLISALGAQPVGLPFGEVYGALERGVVDCAITGTGSGNSAKWFEVANTMFVLPVAWSTGAYYVNLPWWNKLDATTRNAIAAQFKAVEDGLWKMGADATDDGVQCNVGNAAACKIGSTVTSRPMKANMPTDADRAEVRRQLAEKVLPAWVQRCDPKSRCGEVFNEVLAPITGVKYAK
jgi:TRAP-type C4-dicarboxylate transport system substrate-binding protein